MVPSSASRELALQYSKSSPPATPAAAAAAAEEVWMTIICCICINVIALSADSSDCNYKE